MTVALTRGNSTNSKVLCLAAVEAIRHLLENEVEEDKVVQQDMLMHLKYIPQMDLSGFDGESNFEHFWY